MEEFNENLLSVSGKSYLMYHKIQLFLLIFDLDKIMWNQNFWVTYVEQSLDVLDFVIACFNTVILYFHQWIRIRPHGW